MAGIGSCGYIICAVITIIVNLIIFLVGLVLAGLGGGLLFGQDLVKSQVQPMLNGLLSTLASSTNGPQIDVAKFITDIMKSATPVAVPLLIIGILLVLMSFCGMFGACCKSKCLLLIYVCFCGIMFLIALIFTLIFHTNKDQYLESFKNTMVSNIKSEYTGLVATNPISLVINAMHAMLKCCGMNNGTDFMNATKWNRTLSQTYNGHTVTLHLQYPLTCCKLNNFKPVDANCSFEHKPSNSNYQTGCASVLFGTILSYVTYVIGAFGAVTGLLFLLLLCGALMLYDAAQSKQVHPSK